MNNDKEFWPGIFRIWLMRALEGESKIQESINWTPATKAWLPLAQFVVMCVGILAMLLGLFGIGSQVGYSLGWNEDWRGYLLLASLVVLLFIVIQGLVRILISADAMRVSLLICTGLVILLMIAPVMKDTRLNVVRIAALVTGYVLFLPGLALTYRMAVDLMDPFGKTSPIERQMFPNLRHLFPQEEEVSHEKRVLEVHIQDKGTTLIVGSEDLGIDDEDLIRFAKMAPAVGLAETHWGTTFKDGINSYRKFRAKMVEKGLVVMADPNAPNKGFILTVAGKAFLKRIAEEAA